MLSTLLKYDLRATRKVNVTLLVSSVLASIVGSLAFFAFITVSFIEKPTTAQTFGAVAAMLVFIMSIMTVVMACGIAIILVFYRFYKNLYTDEGYLTFTLPVRKKDILLSKTLHAVIWYAAVAITGVICFIIYSFSIPRVNVGEEEGFLQELIIMLVGTEFTEWLPIYTILLVILLISYVLFSISIVHFCITLGSVVAKKHKLLAGIGFYYLANSVISIVTQLLSWNSFFIIDSFGDSTQLGYLLILVIITVIVSLAALILYMSTLRMMKKKLNIA